MRTTDEEDVEGGLGPAARPFGGHYGPKPRVVLGRRRNPNPREVPRSLDSHNSRTSNRTDGVQEVWKSRSTSSGRTLLPLLQSHTWYVRRTAELIRSEVGGLPHRILTDPRHCSSGARVTEIVVLNGSRRTHQVVSTSPVGVRDPWVHRGQVIYTGVKVGYPLFSLGLRSGTSRSTRSGRPRRRGGEYTITGTESKTSVRGRSLRPSASGRVQVVLLPFLSHLCFVRGGVHLC